MPPHPYPALRRLAQFNPFTSQFLNPFMPTMKGTLANSVDPDQTPQKAVSDQDLHCFHLGQELL